MSKHIHNRHRTFSKIPGFPLYCAEVGLASGALRAGEDKADHIPKRVGDVSLPINGTKRGASHEVRSRKVSDFRVWGITQHLGVPHGDSSVGDISVKFPSTQRTGTSGPGTRKLGVKWRPGNRIPRCSRVVFLNSRDGAYGISAHGF